MPWLKEKGILSVDTSFIFLTSPSSGQAATNSLLRRPRLPACHSGAALDGAAEVEPGNDLPKIATTDKIDIGIKRELLRMRRNEHR